MPRDLQQALRRLAAHKTVTLLAVLSLALGIGATTVLFSVVDATVLDPLPFPESEELVSIYLRLPTDGTTRGQLRPVDGDYLELARFDHRLDGLAAIASTGNPLRLGDRTLTPLLREATAGYFELLGVAPTLGRTFDESEMRIGGSDVVVLTWSFWQEELGGRQDVLGSVLEIDRRPHSVIGVMPQGFRDPLYPTAPALWLPLRIRELDEDGEALVLARGGRRGERAFLRVFGRMDSAGSLGDLNSRLETLSGDLAARYPENEDRTLFAMPLVDDTVAGHQQTVWLLFGAVALVLAVACTNVGSLLLGQAAQRRSDVAVQRALGASGMTLAKQFLTESVVLSLLGGLLGIAVAVVTLPLVGSWAVSNLNLPSHNAIDLDWRVLAFAVALSIVSGLAFGLVPLRQALRVGSGSLRSARTTPTRRSSSLRAALVIGELALSVVLLVAAGLMLRSLVALTSVPAGVEEDGAVLLRTAARGNFAGPERWADFERQVRAALVQIPGVEAVGAANVPPIFDGGRPVALDLGDVARDDAEPTANLFLAGEGLFEALGTELVAGRAFQSSDLPDAAPVALVNRAFVERFASESSTPSAIVGSTLRFAEQDQVARTIVGVVGDIRRPGIRPEPVPMLFLPLSQSPLETVSYVVRSSVESALLLEQAEHAIKNLSAESPVYNTDTLGRALGRLTMQQSLLGSLLSGFAVIGVLLACLGTYALLAQWVHERRRELGIRMAFGARPRDIVALMRREASALGLAGLLIGGVVAAVSTTGLRSQLYGVASLDPITYALVAIVLFVVVLVAALVPTLRAARVDPALTLRRES